MSALKSPVKVETDYSYTNKFNGKSIHFSPKADEVMASLQPQQSPASMRDVMAATRLSVSQSLNVERGYAVFKVSPGNDLQTAAQALEDQPQVLNTLPVLIDDEGLTRYVLPDELTVQFRPGISPEAAEAMIAAQGCQIVKQQRTPGYYTLAVPPMAGLFETLRRFSELAEVAFAEPSEVGFNDALLYLPDDPDFPKLWALHNSGQAVNGLSGIPDADIDAAEAWDLCQGDPEVIAVVIDTGMDLNHPDLAANLLPRGSEDWDFGDAGDASPDDSNGHGTHVAGTIAAVDNVTGVIGVAPKCRLMPLRIDLSPGMNQNRADAINYAAAQAAANPTRRYVINCSWRMSGDHAGVHNAIINAVNNNVVVVFAAGNANQDTGITPQYPGVYPEVISVAATNQADQRASFSNYGTNVDVSAPGVNIYSTYPDDSYAFLDGTSMASPHVAGLAALIWSRNKHLTNQQVRSLIETTCDNIDAQNPGFVGKLGTGRINACRALAATPLPPIRTNLVRRLKFPQQNRGSSSALAFARRFPLGLRRRSVLLFLTQQPFSENIYFLHPTTGAVLGQVDPQNNETIGSMEWDGTHLQVANVTTGAGAINKLDPLTGAQISSLPVPEGRGEGMAFDGTFLYYSTITHIHGINPTTGAVVRAFPAPGGNCRALAHIDGYLLSGNSTTGEIVVFDAMTLAVRGTIAAPGLGSEKVEGLAYNPATRELFIANQSENIIYVMEVEL